MGLLNSILDKVVETKAGAAIVGFFVGAGFTAAVCSGSKKTEYVAIPAGEEGKKKGKKGKKKGKKADGEQS